VSRLGPGTVLGAAGALAALAGLAIVLSGDSGPFSFTFEFALLVGLLAVVQGLRYGMERRRTSYAALSVGDPEERYAAPPPGREFDESLTRTSGRTLRAVNGRRELRRRVHAAAVTTLAATAGVPEAEAARRIEAGTWTDDPVAARFLANGSVPLSASLRALVRGESRFSVGIRHAVAAVAALDASTPGSGPGTAGGDGRGWNAPTSRRTRASRLGATLRERVRRVAPFSLPGTGARNGRRTETGWLSDLDEPRDPGSEGVAPGPEAFTRSGRTGRSSPGTSTSDGGEEADPGSGSDPDPDPDAGSDSGSDPGAGSDSGDAPTPASSSSSSSGSDSNADAGSGSNSGSGTRSGGGSTSSAPSATDGGGDG
jgi:hypothetical protein